MTDIAALMPELIKLIQQAGRCIMGIYAGDHQASQKSDDTRVSAANLAAKSIILKGLEALTPDIPVIAEEIANTDHTSAIGHFFWLVDPLDGAKEFIQKNGEFTVNIALIEEGKPVLGLVLAPALDELYGGIVGQGAWVMCAGTTHPISARKPAKKGLTVVSSRAHGEILTLQNEALRYGKPRLENPHFYAQGNTVSGKRQPLGKKVFLLGMGAQKAGTTWLYEYLYKHPNTDLGFKKEYHIFDALFIPECSQFLTGTITQALQHLKQKNLTGAAEKELFKSLDFLANTDNYFDYFETLANKSQTTKLTGDMTPAYSGLPVQTLVLIKSKLLERGLRPKVVFLMRDPVERCVSAFRMNLRRSQSQPSTKEQEEQLIQQGYNSRECEIRTRYDQTIENLESVFETSEIFYGFYETMFSEATIKRLCEFLEIPFFQPDFQYQVNVSRTSNEINTGLLEQIYKHYKPVYDFVSQKFGASFVDAIWPERKA